MTGFQQVTIGFESGGLTLDRKPPFIPNEAYSELDNAYVWRGRTKKRDGTVTVDRLTRTFTGESLGNSGASPWTVNIYSALSITPETNAEIKPGSVEITIATIGTPFVDNGAGKLTNTTGGNSGTINYMTGDVTLTHTAGAGQAATIDFMYYPSLPVMGIIKRDSAEIGVEETVYFDTVYAYQFTGGNFQQLGTATWTGSITNLFWGANYQGATQADRYFFATNNNITQGNDTPYDPIRYFDGSMWNDFQPELDATNILYQARVIIPYYGRLLALNTWEGAEDAMSNPKPSLASNYFSRCRFSQIGNPVAMDAWRSDTYGKGGFIDAPTNESIVSVAYYRNTLLVFFEYSTWQLRYIGEYGLPFIFERISSDFGSSCTNSPIVFDEGVMEVSDRGILIHSAAGVARLDSQIPDTAFAFEIANEAVNFVHGLRDFEKELVYWNYIDTNNNLETQLFPNTVLLYNYANKSWAKFRDTITAFGPGQFPFTITWDSLTVTWDDADVSWDSTNDQTFTTYNLAGNQQGFIIIYNSNEASTDTISPLAFGESLAITSIDLTTSPVTFIVPNHNLYNGEFVYLLGTIWEVTDPPTPNPGLDNKIYKVQLVTTAPADPFSTLTFLEWDGVDYNPVNSTSLANYIGGGRLILLPKINLVGKDFNPFQAAGKAFKLSYIDFQIDSSQSIPNVPIATVQLFINSYTGAVANINSCNTEVFYAQTPAKFISGATQSNPCQITSIGHSLQTGDQILIANVQGMTQLNNINYVITVVDANNFTLNSIDSTGFSAYTKLGTWNKLPVLGQQNTSGSLYSWVRFYCTTFGQYMRIGITYDDDVMNQVSTHQTPFELNAMNIWFRDGGKLFM